MFLDVKRNGAGRGGPLVIPALRRLQGHPGLHSELRASPSYAARLCLKKQKKKKNGMG